MNCFHIKRCKHLYARDIEINVEVNKHIVNFALPFDDVRQYPTKEANLHKGSSESI